jgi:hypothetical protein
MRIVRLIAVLAVAAIGGCTFWGKKAPPDRLAELGHAAAPPIYFSGETPTAFVSQPLGPVAGFSCGQGALSGSAPPDEATALNALGAKAKAAGGTAVVNASCRRTTMFGNYQIGNDPTQFNACWPGFRCTGEAVR